jgi:hypothetical protein
MSAEPITDEEPERVTAVKIAEIARSMAKLTGGDPVVLAAQLAADTERRGCRVVPGEEPS